MLSEERHDLFDDGGLRRALATLEELGGVEGAGPLHVDCELGLSFV